MQKPPDADWNPPTFSQRSSRHLRGDAANQFGDHQIHLESRDVGPERKGT